MTPLFLQGCGTRNVTGKAMISPFFTVQPKRGHVPAVQRSHAFALRNLDFKRNRDEATLECGGMTPLFLRGHGTRNVAGKR